MNETNGMTSWTIVWKWLTGVFSAIAASCIIWIGAEMRALRLEVVEMQVTLKQMQEISLRAQSWRDAYADKFSDHLSQPDIHRGGIMRIEGRLDSIDRSLDELKKKMP